MHLPLGRGLVADGRKRVNERNGDLSPIDPMSQIGPIRLAIFLLFFPPTQLEANLPVLRRAPLFSLRGFRLRSVMAALEYEPAARQS